MADKSNKQKKTSSTKTASLSVAENVIKKKKKYRWLGFSIFCFAFILYANTYNHDWVLDDYGTYKLNIYVTNGFDGFGDILTKTYRHGSGFYTDNLYRPFSQLMFAAEWHFFPDQPGVSHLINVLFYALSCALLFAFLRKLMKKYIFYVPLVITLLFVAHPIHTEVVANIKSRDEIMSFFFIVCTYLSVLGYVDKRKWYYLLLAPVFFLFAFFSKESAITFLAAIPLTLYFFREVKIKDYLLITGLLIIPAVIYLSVRYAVLQQYAASEFFTVSIMDNYFYDQKLLTRWATAIMLLGKYLLMLFVPYRLVCDYSYSQLPITAFTDLSTLLSLVVYLSLLVYAIMGVKKKDPIAFGIWFYLISISIYSNLFYLIGSSFAERFLYSPSLGFIIAVVFAVVRLARIDVAGTASSGKMKNSIIIIVLTAVLITFSIKTVARSAEWVNQYTLFGADVKKSDNSAHMRLYWGLALRDKGIEYDEKNKGETDWNKIQNNDLQYHKWTWESVAQFKKAIEIYPQYADCYEQLGLLYDGLGVKDNQPSYRDSAEYYYLQSIRYLPTKSTANSNLAKIYYEKGEIRKAKTYYLASILYDPLFSDGYYNLGSTYGALGNYDSSFYYYKKCLQLNPQKVEAYAYMGLNYANLNKLDSATALYDLAIKKDPLNYAFYILKGKALMKQNDWQRAVQVFDKAVEVNPYVGEAFFYKGKVAVLRGDFKEALQCYEKCIAVSPQYREAYYEKYLIFKQLHQPDSAQYYKNILDSYRR